MNNQEQLAALYGPAAQHCDYRIDERVSWVEGTATKQGVVIYVAAPTTERALTYVVSPDVEEFPVELGANEIIALADQEEYTLDDCRINTHTDVFYYNVFIQDTVEDELTKPEEQ